MQVQSILVLLSKSLGTGKHNILLKKEDKSLPAENIMYDSNTFSTASELIKELIGVEVRVGSEGWLPLCQIGVFDNEKRVEPRGDRVVSIGYIAIIPDLVKCISDNYEWFPLEDIMKEKLYFDHSEILTFILTHM